VKLSPALFLLPLTGSTVVPAVGVHNGACDVIGSGHHHHFVSALVSTQSEDRFRRVSGG